MLSSFFTQLRQHIPYAEHLIEVVIVINCQFNINLLKFTVSYEFRIIV